jgi:hypothetical protein
MPTLPLKRLVLHITAVGLGDRGGLDPSGTTGTTAEIATAIQPGSVEGTLGLECANLRLHLESQTNVIQTVDKAVLAEGVNVEGNNLVALCILDLLVVEIDLDFTTSVSLVGDLLQGNFIVNNDGKHAVLESVVEEDIGE